MRPLEGKDGKFGLIAGFRRYSAVGMNAAKTPAVGSLGLQPGQIRVKVHAKLTEVDAILLNLDENVVAATSPFQTSRSPFVALSLPKKKTRMT